MNSLRETVAGGKPGVKRQLCDELKTTSREARSELLSKAGIQPCIPAGEGLAMKAELSIPWSKLRFLRK